jgi:hypothetical protein
MNFAPFCFYCGRVCHRLTDFIKSFLPQMRRFFYRISFEYNAVRLSSSKPGDYRKEVL